MSRDPVCGMDVDDEAHAPKSIYKGRTYYFCCEGCKQEFDQDPEDYIPGEGERG